MRDNPLKRIAPESHRRGVSNPLEEAWEAAHDAQDIIRDKRRREARQLPDYSGDDEDTKRTDVRSMHVHVHQHSQPDVDDDPQIELGPVKMTGVPKWLVVVVGAVVAAATALLAHLKR